MSGFESPGDRRDFFRSLARKLVGPLVESVAGVPSPAPRHATSMLLQPPGAVPEPSFSELCQRCGKCVQTCPVQAIRPWRTQDPRRNGTPVIDADVAACVVCAGVLCTQVCPSGALLPIENQHQINMGLAEVYATLCVRSGGDACRVCVDRCPLGETAIRLPVEGPPEVFPSGCVGCGVCQLYCPTSPKAIVVQPRGNLESSPPTYA